jgi:hypothetical protein
MLDESGKSGEDAFHARIIHVSAKPVHSVFGATRYSRSLTSGSFVAFAILS